jgi:LAS superfamily LD-carboxypeptidase LdcB
MLRQAHVIDIGFLRTGIRKKDRFIPETETVHTGITLSNGEEVVLDESKNWTATVTGLPKYSNGQLIDYPWTEDETGLPEGYEPSDLAYPEVEMRYNNWTMRWDAAVALEEMFKDAEKDDIHLVMGSGYRSESFQKTLYDGYAEESGSQYADSISSRPGYSDHQTGLATDLCGQDTQYDLTQEFEKTPEGKWLAENAWKYGFIMRYPKGKDKITGYTYEPWHFRYITKEEAKKIHDAGENMTFEEFYGISGGDYAD